MSNTFKATVSGTGLNVDQRLDDWGISIPQSNMIAYIAVNSPKKKLFIQWANGTGNFYNEVDMLTLNGIVTAPSAGKLFHQFIKGKFDGEKVESPLISLAPEDDHEEGVLLDDEEDDDTFNDFNENNW